MAIQTKSNRILRDLDLLKSINDHTKAVVQMTLTTYDEDLCRLIEQGVCTTAQRVAALKQFRDAGIPTVVQQSAYDMGCEPEDFLSNENVVGISQKHPLARKYLDLPLSCDLVSYGSNIVAQASEEIAPLVRQYIDRYPVEHCFETPNLHVLDEQLRPFGQKICFMAEYFLPDVDAVKALFCDYELRVLDREDFADLYLPQWSNALCEKRKHLDVLGVGAYDKGKLIGLAGCSADCDMMYQIGVDVLPEYRRKGVASALTSRLAIEILALDKVPFYCAAWCNIKSVRNAIRSGFRPAGVEITAKNTTFVDRMNGKR